MSPIGRRRASFGPVILARVRANFGPGEWRGLEELDDGVLRDIGLVRVAGIVRARD